LLWKFFSPVMISLFFFCSNDPGGGSIFFPIHKFWLFRFAPFPSSQQQGRRTCDAHGPPPLRYPFPSPHHRRRFFVFSFSLVFQALFSIILSPTIPLVFKASRQVPGILLNLFVPWTVIALFSCIATRRHHRFCPIRFPRLPPPFAFPYSSCDLSCYETFLFNGRETPSANPTA